MRWGAPVVAAGLLLDQARRAAARRRRRTASAAVRLAAVDRAVAGVPRTGGDAPGDAGSAAVVMAAWNEAPSLPAVLATLPREVAGLRVVPVVVDDGSADGTAAVARRGGAVVAVHERNLGQGDALRTGFAVASRLGAQVVVTMDADGQHDPADLPALVGPVVAGEADYVQGSRFLGAYDDAGGVRHAGIRVMTAVLNAAAGTRITDGANGFRAVRASGLARLQLVEDRFSASEIVLQAARRGLRILEVPVHVRSRQDGTSKKPRGIGYPLGYLGVVVRSRLRADRPAAQSSLRTVVSVRSTSRDGLSQKADRPTSPRWPPSAGRRGVRGARRRAPVR